MGVEASQKDDRPEIAKCVFLSQILTQGTVQVIQTSQYQVILKTIRHLKEIVNYNQI